MLKPLSHSAQHRVKELQELESKKKLERLRKYLVEEGILSLNKKKHADAAAITMDHLKKLARVWKLHHAPGFWKNHSTKDLIVRALPAICASPLRSAVSPPRWPPPLLPHRALPTRHGPYRR